MNKLLRLVAATAVSVGLSTGVAAAQSGSITGPTGPSSTNSVKNDTTLRADIDNHNSAGIGNLNGQLAGSGDANASTNTTVGNVGSGNASNSNTVSSSVTQSNTGNSLCGCAGLGSDPSQTGSIMGATGPNSNNTVTNTSTTNLDVSNSNRAGVLNLSFQGALSGDANANNNTTVGDVTSGNVSNSNSTSTMITQSN